MDGYTVESSAKAVLDLNEKIRVLHVDDDSVFLEIAKHCLEMKGPFQVDTALSVEEAAAKLEKENYDVIVSEYQMPGKDGLQFLRELREKGSTIPFIVFTRRSRKEVAIKALNLGAKQYLNKVGEPETVCTELAHSITELAKIRKAEEEIRDSEEKFRDLFEKANDGFVFVDLSGRIVDVNQKAAEIVERKKEDIVGKSFFELGFVSSKDLPVLFKRLGQGTMGKSTGSFEFEVGNEDSEKKLIEISSTLIQRHNIPAGALVIFRDITERKKTDRLTAESQQKFARLFNGNPEATVYTDPAMHILDVNPRFTRLFGYSLDEVKGKNLNSVVVPKNLIEEGKMLDKKTTEGYVYHDTLRMRKDGSLVPVSISAAQISIRGQLTGYIGVYKDISMQESAEQNLIMMNEKLRVVGGLTRHDVRNKLSVITGNIFLNKKRLKDHPDVIESLEDMESACGQIVRIFDFAKDYERLGVEELTYVDVEDAVQKAASLFSNLKGVVIACECPGLTVLADSLLRQFFYNLIDNSLKHGEKITQIRIYYEESGEDLLRLIHEDDGIGISQEAKSKIFSEGYSSGKGSGYGLFLIKKIMEVYGWTIQETGKPERGAQFTITIPKTNQNMKENYRIVRS